MPNINTSGPPITNVNKIKLFGMDENEEVGWIFSNSLVPVAHELGDDPDLAVSQKLLTDSITDMEQSNEEVVVEATHQAGLAGDSAVIATEQAERVVAEFRTFVASSGYQFAGDYATGMEITQYNQIIRDENGEFWRVSGQVDLPYVTTGAGIPEDDAFVPAGDAVLRQDLASPDKGALMVRGAVIYVDTIADLQALDTSGLVSGRAAVLNGVKGGAFEWRPGDFSAEVGDDPAKGVRVPPLSHPDGSQGAWFRRDTTRAPVLVTDFRMDSDGDDIAPALARALVVSSNVRFPPNIGEPFKISSTVNRVITDDVTIDFAGQRIEFTSNISLSGESIKSDATLATHVDRYATSVTLDDAEGAQPGDLLYIYTNVVAETDWEYKKCDTVKIKEVVGNDLELEEPVQFAYQTTDSGLKVRIWRPYRVTILHPNFYFVERAGQAMMEFSGLHDIYVHCPVGSGEGEGYDFSITRRMMWFGCCWGVKIHKPYVEHLGYPFLVVSGTRGTRVTEMTARHCHHSVESATWAVGVYVNGLDASDCDQAVSSHPAFEVHYENVRVMRDRGLSNLRCLRASLKNATIHTLADDSHSGPYYHRVAVASGFEYLREDADLVIDNVEIISPNRTTPAIGANGGRVARIDGLTAKSGFSVSNGWDYLVWGSNDLGESRESFRSPTRVTNNPMLPARLDNDVYHIDLFNTQMDQSNRYIKCYGPIASGISDDPATLRIRLHTNAFSGLDIAGRVAGIIKLKAFQTHLNSGGFATIEKHYNFLHKVVTTSSAALPNTPVYTSEKSGQQNETLDIQVEYVDHQSTGIDTWIEFDVTLSSGRTSPSFSLIYELDLRTV